jgi:hypothetical protein
MPSAPTVISRILINRAPLNLMSRKNRQRHHSQKLLPGDEQYPSAQTFYRLAVLDERGKKMVEQAMAQIEEESVLSRDASAIDRIKGAQTPDELLDLVPISTGLAQAVWLEQMRRLRLGAAPIIAERIVALATTEDESARGLAEERLVAALYICGQLGAEHLLRCFDSLSLYGQSLACLALGKAGEAQAADRIWAYYERVKNYALERFLVGPLWALIDLQDPRAPAALAELLRSRREFLELCGLTALAGDRQVVVPLLDRFMLADEEARDDYAYALAAVSHRIGRQAIRAEMMNRVTSEVSDRVLGKLVETFWALKPEDIQNHFEIFYGQS